MNERIPVFELPFLWARFSGQGNPDRLADPSAIFAVLDEARAIFGVVLDLDVAGVTAFVRLFEREIGPAACIVLSVFPGCPTTAEDLNQLLALVRKAPSNRVLFRVFPADSRRVASATAVCGLMQDERAILATGPGGLFSSEIAPPTQANIVAECEPLLLERVRSWFEPLWELAAPLDENTANLPALTGAPANGSAVRAWQRYVRLCDLSTPTGVASNSAPPVESGRRDLAAVLEDDVRAVTPALESGSRDLAAVPNDIRAVEQSVTAVLGIPRVDGLANEVSRIVNKGLQVAIDGTSRIPPLSTSIPAELFGLEASEQLGSIHRQTTYRIAAFDPKSQRAIENLRTRLSSLLRQLCYSLGNGLYWIPRSAIPLLEREVARIDTHGVKRLKESLGSDVAGYVEQQRKRVTADAERAYQQIRPGAPLPEGVVREVLEALEKRLTAATAGRFLPQLSYSEMRWSFYAPTSLSASRWGQPLTFLHSIAELPRRVITDRRYLLGTEVDDRELLSAMNVAEDDLIAKYLANKPVRNRAQHELEVLASIMDSDTTADVEFAGRARCEAILRLMGGGAGTAGHPAASTSSR